MIWLLLYFIFGYMVALWQAHREQNAIPFVRKIAIVTSFIFWPIALPLMMLDNLLKHHG